MFSKDSKQLRVFHNKVKSLLIRKYANNSNLLIDIGVGRGGDMYKWNKCNIRNVYGYDIDEISILEANKRYDLSEIDKSVFKYSFYYHPDIQTFVHSLKHANIDKVNHISCQFVIHYFFQNESSINDFFSNISGLLKLNGVFFGTFMCAERLRLLTNTFTTSFHNSSFFVNPSTIDESNDVGNRVDVHLTNTLYFGEQSVSIEYLVFKDVLTKYAKQYGLDLIEFKDFSEFYNDQNVSLSDDNKICSFCYSTFAFKKSLKEP